MSARVELYKQAIEKYGTEKQTDKAIEELAELTAAIQKYLYGRIRKSAVIEEMADVQIMLEQLALIFKISDDSLRLMKTVKLNRLKRKVDGDEDEA